MATIINGKEVSAKVKDKASCGRSKTTKRKGVHPGFGGCDCW